MITLTKHDTRWNLDHGWVWKPAEPVVQVSGFPKIKMKERKKKRREKETVAGYWCLGIMRVIILRPFRSQVIISEPNQNCINLFIYRLNRIFLFCNMRCIQYGGQWSRDRFELWDRLTSSPFVYREIKYPCENNDIQIFSKVSLSFSIWSLIRDRCVKTMIIGEFRPDFFR